MVATKQERGLSPVQMRAVEGEMSAPGRNVQLKGMDLEGQDAALDPNQQPGFDEQEANQSPEADAAGKVMPGMEKFEFVSIDITSMSIDDVAKVSGTMTLKIGKQTYTREVAFRGPTGNNDANSWLLVAQQLAADYEMSPKAQDKLLAVLKAKWPSFKGAQ